MMQSSKCLLNLFDSFCQIIMNHKTRNNIVLQLYEKIIDEKD